MKLFKKATAVLALVTLMSGIFSTGVSAYSTAQADAANVLAASGIIVSHSNDADYNLDQNVLRQEIAAVARGVAGLDKKTTCDGTFSDVTATTPNNWACYSVEALADAELIAHNSTFRPEANISKSEAVGMMVKAAYGDEYSYDSSLSTSWQEQVVGFAVEKGIISNFTNYDTQATRGFVFEVGASALVSGDTVSDDDLLNDLLGDLLGDDDTDTDTDTGSTVVVSGDNVLSVTLSPDTPAAATIPGAINGIPVASFDMTAGSEDVTVTSLIVKRAGLSQAATLTSLAVFTSEGRVSKGKNDSEENDTQATLNLNSGGVTIMAGSTETFTIVVDVAATATTNGHEFAIELLDVSASSDVEGVDNLVGSTMKIGGVDAATLTVDTNGTVSDPTLGKEDADIFKFKLVNANDTDIIVKSLTFKGNGTIDEEDELADFVLFDNMGNVVATTATTNGKYLTFDLGDGFTVAENKTEKFKVQANIIGGAGKTIDFYIDKNLDVTAEDTQYGFGASVTITNVDAATNLCNLTVQAGEITLIDIDPTVTIVKEDKKDIILGKIKVVNNAGSNLEMQKFGVKIVIGGGLNVVDVLDNIELYDETNGTTYDLADINDGTNNGATEAFQDSDLNITIPTGETVFAIRADTVSSIAAFDTRTITASVASGDVSANGGLYIVETDDDTVVTDITPSSISFKTVNGSESSATITVLPTAVAITAVIGSTDVEALEFEVEADESSALSVTDVVIDAQASSVTFDSDLVTQVKLYKDSVSDSNLINTVSASQISSEKATFDGFTVNVPADGKVKFIVTVSILDDATLAAETINMALDSDATNIRVSMEDEDSDDVVFAGGADLASATVITINDVGTLAASVDTTDSEVSTDKNILGNTTSSFVASYEFNAQNEDILVEDLVITATEVGATDNFESAVSEVILYKENKTTEIARKSVTSNVVTFSNLNYVVEQGTENIYVKVVTRKIGKGLAGVVAEDGFQLELTVTEAEGNESGKDVDVTAIDAIGDVAVTPSNTFLVVPTKISAVAFVSSYGGISRESTLTHDVDNVLAIISITADSSTNIDSADGSSLRTALSNIEIAKQGVAVEDFAIVKINGSDSNGTGMAALLDAADDDTDGDNLDLATGDANGVFDLTGLTSDDDKVDNGTTVYFKVVGKPQLTATAGESVKISLPNLDDDTANLGLDYTTDDSAAAVAIDVLNLGFSELSGTSVAEAN